MVPWLSGLLDWKTHAPFVMPEQFHLLNGTAVSVNSKYPILDR